MILLDTSAIFALTSSKDASHATAHDRVRRISEAGEPLLIHSYILLEAFALIERRLGFEAAAKMSDEVAALPTVVVDRDLHDRGVRYLREARRRRPSLVDAVSFLVMQDRGIDTAFAFDDDFRAAGFRLYGL